MRSTPTWTSRLLGLVCGVLSGGAVLIGVMDSTTSQPWPIVALGVLGSVVIGVVVGTWVERLPS